MDPAADALRRAIELMENALQLLDGINASDAAALLDHAIHAARDHGQIVGDRPSSELERLEKAGMTSPDETGTLNWSRLAQDPNHPFKTDRA